MSWHWFVAILVGSATVAFLASGFATYVIERLMREWRR